jgi:hypothetical protein
VRWASRALSSDRCEKGESPSRLVHLGIDDGRQVPETRCSSEKRAGKCARVCALAFTSLGRGLVYDRALAREALMKARAPR